MDWTGECPICLETYLMPTISNSGISICSICSAKAKYNICPLTRVWTITKYPNHLINKFIRVEFDIKTLLLIPNRKQYIMTYDRIEIRNYNTFISNLNRLQFDLIVLMLDRIDPIREDDFGYNLTTCMCFKIIHITLFKYYFTNCYIDLNAVIYRPHGMRIIHILAQEGHLDNLKFIIERGVDLMGKDKMGNTVLHYACAFGDIEIIKLLLELNVGTECVNNANATAIIAAARFRENPSEIIDILVSNGANIYHKWKNGVCVLNMIIERKLTDQFIYLVDKYFNIDCDFWNKNEITHYVCNYGTYEMFEHLIKKGVNLNVRNKFRELPLHVICRNQSLKWLSLLPNANFDVMADDGCYPIHYICYHGSFEMLKYAIEKYDININCVSASGTRPIHIICRRGTVEMLKYIISLGADVNCYDDHGWCPLHYVKDVAMMKVLIDDGYVDIHTKTKDNNYSAKFIEIRSAYLRGIF